MKDRTLLVLQALIDDFVQSATPISSQKLLQTHQLSVSSATIRNEFAILEDSGFIRSPHVSSGKVPTEQGYEFFVKELMRPDPDEAREIQNLFEQRLSDYKKAKIRENIFDILRVLSHCSNGTAFAIFDDEETFYLGLSNVLKSPEFQAEPELGAQVVEILEGREQFIRLIQSLDLKESEPRVFIGNRDLIEEISSCSLVAISFKNQYASGTLGILGPMRMRYSTNKILLENAVHMIL